MKEDGSSHDPDKPQPVFPVISRRQVSNNELQIPIPIKNLHSHALLKTAFLLMASL